MTNSNLLTQIAKAKIVPVVKLDCSSNAKPLGEALCTGGLPVAEVTFRTDAAEESIRLMKNAFPEMLVGAGTVVNLEQAKRALNAGASFIVSPGFSHDVVKFSLDNHIPIFPGTCTPTEVMLAIDYALPVVKFFPAQQYGGLATIKALSAPFANMQFMPTGGISTANIMDYLAFDKIIACGGSWMVTESLINVGDFSKITQLTAEAVALVK